MTRGPQAKSINLVLESCVGIERALQVARFARQLMRQGFSLQVVGLGGTVERPRMLVPLRSNILRYVHTVAFRGTDSPLRVWFKRLAGCLPAGLAWRGPLVLVAAPEPATFDRFVLLTDDRAIAFLFRDEDKAPWAVRKSGAREELIAEYRKHRRAGEILGQWVPGLIELTEDGAKAAMTLEAIPERFLGNLVAAAPWRKQAVFVREALGHLDFCREVYRLLAEKGGMDQVRVEAGEVQVLLEGLGPLLDNAGDGGVIMQALNKTIGLTLPRLIQHGDFCVRNVLIAGGARGRVLIDWEDMQERRWPLVDFALLRLSLKEVYAGLFAADLTAMERLPAMAEGLAAAEKALMDVLRVDRSAFRAAQMLSLACLCRQNLAKGRLETATSIFRELLAVVRHNLETQEAKAAS